MAGSDMKKNGFTLVEIVIAIAILSIAVFPFMQVLTQNLRVSMTTKQTYIGSHYAKALAEEIKLRHFGTTAFPMPAGAVSFDRRTYDDVDDYNGYDESANGGITDLSGVSFENSYFRMVRVEPVDSSDLRPIIIGTIDVKRVTVECWVVENSANEMITAIEFYVSSGG